MIDSNCVSMRTLEILISDFEFNKLGLKDDKLSFLKFVVSEAHIEKRRSL